MTITTTAKLLPGAVAHAYLRAARLPLRAVGFAVGQQDNEQWPPAMAFESLEAGVDSVIGSLTNDPELMRSAEVRRAKLSKLREAAVLDTQATQKRQQAEEKFEVKREAADGRRKAAADEAEQRKSRLADQAKAREKAAEKKAAKKTASASAAKAKQDQVVQRRERAATLESLDAESDALDQATEAAEAERTVEVIDDTLEGEKQARQSG
jgi:hypothetical protein